MERSKKELFDFEKLNVYQKSLDFVDRVYDLTDSFPVSEIYNLTSQFKRASYSIALNIGEGSGGTRREFIRFLIIAKRSLRECIVCTTISARRKYFNSEMELNLRDQLTEISKMLSGLISYVESEKAKNTLYEPLENYNKKKSADSGTDASTNHELPTPN